MRISLKTKELTTDAGEFLKKLHCPLQKTWTTMEPTSQYTRTCTSCSRQVHDTAQMTDGQLKRLLAKDPTTCLAVSPTQLNCTVID